MLCREVRIGLADIDASRKKLLKNLIKEDEVRDLLLKNQMVGETDTNAEICQNTGGRQT